MGIGSQQYPKPGEREEEKLKERICETFNVPKSVIGKTGTHSEAEIEEAHSVVEDIISRALDTVLSRTVSDQRKVIEALWMLKCGWCKHMEDFNEEKYHEIDKMFIASDTLEQFTEKILEAKEPEPEPIKQYCQDCGIEIESMFIFCKDCDKPLSQKDDAHYERIAKLREADEQCNSG